LSSELAIAKGLTIDGSNRAITISGDTGNDGTPNVRVFSIAAGSAVTLSHLHIISGTTSGSGAGLYNAGTLTVIVPPSPAIGPARTAAASSTRGILDVQNKHPLRQTQPIARRRHRQGCGTVTMIHTTSRATAPAYAAVRDSAH
jgi:hypothetical protein